MVATKRKVTKTGVTEVNLESINTVNPIMAASLPGNSEPENTENHFECNNSGVTDVTGVTASNDEACSGNTEKKACVTGVTDLINNAIDPNEEPPEFAEAVVIERPCYHVHDDFNEFGKAGVYYHGIKTDKNGHVTDINYYICDRIPSLIFKVTK